MSVPSLPRQGHYEGVNKGGIREREKRGKEKRRGEEKKRERREKDCDEMNNESSKFTPAKAIMKASTKALN